MMNTEDLGKARLLSEEVRQVVCFALAVADLIAHDSLDGWVFDRTFAMRKGRSGKSYVQTIAPDALWEMLGVRHRELTAKLFDMGIALADSDKFPSKPEPPPQVEDEVAYRPPQIEVGAPVPVHGFAFGPGGKNY